MKNKFLKVLAIGGLVLASGFAFTGCNQGTPPSETPVIEISTKEDAYQACLDAQLKVQFNIGGILDNLKTEFTSERSTGRFHIIDNYIKIDNNRICYSVEDTEGDPGYVLIFKDDTNQYVTDENYDGHMINYRGSYTESINYYAEEYDVYILSDLSYNDVVSFTTVDNVLNVNFVVIEDEITYYIEYKIVDGKFSEIKKHEYGEGAIEGDKDIVMKYYYGGVTEDDINEINLKIQESKEYIQQHT